MDLAGGQVYGTNNQEVAGERYRLDTRQLDKAGSSGPKSLDDDQRSDTEKSEWAELKHQDTSQQSRQYVFMYSFTGKTINLCLCHGKIQPKWSLWNNKS